MNRNLLLTVAVSAAVLAAAVAAIRVSSDRATTARARAAAAASEEAAAEDNLRAETAEASAKAAEARSAEAAQRKAEEDRKAAEAAAVKARVDAEAAEENRKAREAEAETAKAEATAAQARRDEAKLKAEAARDEKMRAVEAAKAAEATAQSEASKLAAEQLRSEKIVAEAKLLELRKIDFEAVQQALIEWRLDLEERERALTPEKTIADLAWAGGESDSVIDAEGKVVKKAKEPYDPEKDMRLSPGARSLAREERLLRESAREDAQATRARIVSSLERLYVAALKENRVIDADFYQKTLKSLYPDWEFKGDHE